MIERASGSLLLANAEALVNTVNCEGFMGKGIALQFKQAFPANFRVYEKACKAGEVKPGTMLVVEPSELVGPTYIINFPTKRHWREKSRLDDIRSGLVALITEIKRLGVKSIAVPPLGCGNGGLDWKAVRPMIEKAFEAVPEVRVLLYEPSGPPPADTMPVRTERPKMTAGRALLIKLIEQYSTLAYRKTLLEVQKLAYFLQVSGEDLRLQYVAHHYGPYAHNLGKVLERIEGHFLRGYGDILKPDVELELLPGAFEEANAFLLENRDSQERLKRVGELIEGFETPYGMELLSSVHWVATQGPKPSASEDEAVIAIQGWNARKKKLFKPEHVRIAWQRLVHTGWISSDTQV